MCGIIFLQDRGELSWRFPSLTGRNQQPLQGQRANPEARGSRKTLLRELSLFNKNQCLSDNKETLNAGALQPKPDWIRAVKLRSSAGAECNTAARYWLYE